jgi:predicted nucleotide-binding protein
MKQGTRAALRRNRARGAVEIRNQLDRDRLAKAPRDAAGLHAVLGAAARKQVQRRPPRVAAEQKIFVVYGRDHQIRDSMFRFLQAIGLKPVSWEEWIGTLGQGSPNVSAVLQTGLTKAAAVVVLLTPDDEVRLKSNFLEGSDPQDEHDRLLIGQARPNVLFEAGMALALSEKSTIIVQCGLTRAFSDIDGRQVLRLDGASASLRALIERLKAVGCAVKNEDGAWESDENFKKAVAAAVKRSRRQAR